MKYSIPLIPTFGWKHSNNRTKTLIVVSIFFSLLFLSITSAQRVYPTPQVSEQACKRLHWSDHSDECKKDLPLIDLAQYDLYKNSQTHRETYTVLRGATYTKRRDQGYGSHLGVDIASAKGTPIVAIREGVVTRAGRYGNRGNVITIKHEREGQIIHSTYAHLETIFVTAGQRVTLGQIIGEMGSTGNSTGNHLHFQIEHNPFSSHPYWYNSCAAAFGLSSAALVNTGVCRNEIVENTVDPIRFLETQGAILYASPVFVGRDTLSLNTETEYLYSLLTAPEDVLTVNTAEFLSPVFASAGSLSNDLLVESSDSSLLDIFPRRINTRSSKTSFSLLPKKAGTVTITLRTKETILEQRIVTITQNESFIVPTSFKKISFPYGGLQKEIIVAMDNENKPIINKPRRGYQSFDFDNKIPCRLTSLKTALYEKECLTQERVQHHYGFKDSYFGILILNLSDYNEDK